jgi:toxin FitB
MYILDTNIVSMLDPRRHGHAPELIGWIKRNGAGLYLSVLTIAEMESGVLKLRREHKADRADRVSELVAAILADFGDRVLGVDLETANHLARLGELVHQQPVAVPDLIIAATACRHGLTVVTRNVREFGRLGLPYYDPFQIIPPDI